MKDYISYMHAHVDVVIKARSELSKAIQKFNTPKPKKKETDEDDGEDDTVFELICVGAYPLEQKEDTFEVTMWGLPKLPIFMNFETEFTPDASVNFDFWIVEAGIYVVFVNLTCTSILTKTCTGGPNGIPDLVKACLRFYMVSIDEEDASRVQWDHFLRDGQAANPSLVLHKYYGDKADPMSALVVAGHLRSWWTGLIEGFKSERVTGTSVVHLADKYTRYLRSVVLHHQGSVECNVFRSARITQAMQIVQKLDWDPIAHTGDSSLLDAMHKVRAKISVHKRHDRYQVANEMFWRTWETLNHSFKMNSSNLAFLIEMMTSQIFWMMGEHNETWAAYFQGIQIKSGLFVFMYVDMYMYTDGHTYRQRTFQTNHQGWHYRRSPEAQQFWHGLDTWSCKRVVPSYP